MDVIDILRGSACLWVVLHHCLSASQAAPGPLHGLLAVLIAISKIGWVGVNLFLVLSGFCLYYPLVRKLDVASFNLDLKTYARRRALRILPAYYAALCVGLGVIAFHNVRHHLPTASGFPGWPTFILHLVMLFNLSPRAFGAYNGAFWSLALECQLYVVFPLLVWFAARRGMWIAAISALCISIMAQYVTYSHFGVLVNWPANDNAAMGYTSLPARVFEFVAGMTAASLVARPSPLQAKSAGAAACCLLPFCLVYAAHARFGPLLDSLWGAEFAALIVVVCAAKSDALVARNPLLRALTWVGTISYSIYLLHLYIVWTFFITYFSRRVGNIDLLAKTGAVFVLAISLGYLFHRCFERPFMPGKPRTERQAEISAAISPAP